MTRASFVSQTRLHDELRRAALTGVANTIAKRMTAIRELAAEKNQQASATEIARQFQFICYGADIRGGPISTSEMMLIAELVPEALGNSRIDVGRLAA
jgi:hypothetical protein